MSAINVPGQMETSGSSMIQSFLAIALMDRLLNVVGIEPSEKIDVSIINTGVFMQATICAQVSDRGLCDRLLSALQKAVRHEDKKAVLILRSEKFENSPPFQVDVAAIGYTSIGAMATLTSLLRRAEEELSAKSGLIFG